MQTLLIRQSNNRYENRWNSGKYECRNDFWNENERRVLYKIQPTYSVNVLKKGIKMKVKVSLRYIQPLRVLLSY